MIDALRNLSRTSLLVAVIVGAVVILAPTVAAAPPGSFAAPEVRVTPPILNFGSVAPGDVKTRMLSVTNVSDHLLRFASFGINQPAPYTLFQWHVGSSWPPCPELQGAERVELMPGDTCTFPVWVQPAADLAAGSYEATFEIDWWNSLTSEQLLLVPLSVNVR